MKKLLSLLLALTMLVGTFTVAVSANELGTIAFINAADNTIVNRLDGVDSLYANVSFIANETGTASVMAAHYDIETGVLTAMEFINTLETTEGEVVEYSTPAIDVAETDLLKVFAWDEDSLAPLAAVGTIDRLLLEDLPTATVTGLDTDDIADVALTFAMNFKADPVTDAQLAYYSNWYADYELTLNKDVTFNMDGTKDGYLAGQYDSWSPAWVTVPKKDVTVAAGESVKIMETAAETYGKPGLKYTYGEVYSRVKDFDCGVYFTPEFLAANNGLEATLVLKMYNPANEAESYVIGVPYTFSWTLPTATVTEIDVSAIEDVALDFALNFKADAVNEDQIAMFADWYADYELTVNKTVTFNADGTADGFLSGQYDAWSENWLSVPTTDATLDANTPVRVMETAAALMGQSGLKLTCYDIFTFVKDFNCGLAFAPEFLVANPDLEVKLSLKIYNPANEEEFYIIGEEYLYTPKTIPSIDKFIAKEGVSYNHTLETAEAGTTTFNFEDLFTVIDGVPVDMENLTVTGATYADGKVTVDGFGEKTITVTDNYYCNEATVTVMVNEPANVDKFTGKTVTYTHTLATIDSNVAEFDFEDLFDVDATYPIKAITLDGATYVDGKVVVEGIGTFTVTATDNYYCNTATATVTINAPENVTKWTATNKTIDLTVNTVGQDQTVNFTDLFTTVDGAVIKAITVTVDNGGSFADGVITVPGKAGTYTVTATDDFYCNPVTAIITVNDAANVDKFTGKNVTYTHTLDTIEANTVTYNFADLFDTNTAYVVKDITVTGATYKDGKITVTGIGTFTITATDNYYCNTATATVTVNAPEAVSKWTANENLAYEITTGDTLTLTLADLFTATGAIIKDADVAVSGATFTKGATWAEGTVAITAGGTYTITINDGFYCNDATATVTVTEKAEELLPSSLVKEDMIANVTDSTDASVGTGNFMLDVFKQATTSVTVKIGVPEDGTYTVESLMDTSNSPYISNDGVTATFDNGESVVWKAGRANGADTWLAATGTVTLTAGNHTVTFTSGDKCSHIYIYGVQLVNEADIPEPTPEPTPDAPAVETVDYTNAPYAGVYQVKSDKAVTLTNETGHTVTLAAGATDYFYLIKGNNEIAGVDGANLTFTALAGNGMDYIANVNAGTTPIISTNTYMGGGDGTDIKNYYVDAENGTCAVGSGYVQIPVGTTAVFEVTPVAGAGLYYMQLQLNDSNTNQMYIETDTGYYCEIGQYQWGWNAFVTSAADDAEFVYLRDGVNTIKVTNNGSATATVGGVKISRTNSLVGNATFDSQTNVANCKVVPYELGGNTEPTPEPTPEVPAWTGRAAEQAGFNGYECDSNFSAKTLAAGEFIKVTINELPYTGVYAFQLKTNFATAPVNVRVLTEDGYYGDYTLNTSGEWTNHTDGQDQPIYMKAGTEVVYIQNIGENTFTLDNIDIGWLNADGFDNSVYDVYAKSGAEIPTEPEPTPTPTPGGSDEPSAPAELTGAAFTAAIINPTNMSIGSDKADFVYGKDASMTVVMGVEAEGDYQLSALFGSNAGYVFNSQITKVYVDGVEVTSFPQSNQMNPNWSPASGTIHLTAGNHEITLSTKTSWNYLYIYGLKLEAK